HHARATADSGFASHPLRHPVRRGRAGWKRRVQRRCDQLADDIVRLYGKSCCRYLYTRDVPCGGSIWGKRRFEITADRDSAVVRRNLRGAPSAAQGLDQSHGRDQLPAENADRGALVAELRRLHRDHVDIAHDAGFALYWLVVRSTDSRAARTASCCTFASSSRMRSAARLSSTSWNPASTAWRYWATVAS